MIPLHPKKPLMEITVISAQGLKNTSTGPFSHRLRPYITITTYPPPPFIGDKNCPVYRTRIDDEGGVNPTWGDKFHVPIDITTAFFANTYSCIYLQLYTKRLIMGRSQLGWCQIPVADIVGLQLDDSVRYLSYRIRDKDCTRGNGVVNLAIKLTGLQRVAGHRLLNSESERKETLQPVTGIPVTLLSHLNICQ